jgi:integrase
MNGEFTSAFAADIEAMLTWREALGYARRTMYWPMLSFDRYCATHHRDQKVLSQELVMAWCQEGVRTQWPSYKASAIRGFATYLRMIGIDAFVLPAGWISTRARPLPHIFTDAELAVFFVATDQIPTRPATPLREYVIPVIFRLILSCGLRPQEARLLRRRDVDTDEGMVLIEASKHNKDRRIPVDAAITRLLARYDEIADLYRARREYFFENDPEHPYPGRWLTAAYHRCRDLAGGVAPGSTPYTLRHNYATRTLTRWVEQGRDLGVWLPYLSAYMGHETYQSTAYYIHLLPERLAATGLTSATGIIPEVTE